VDDTARLARQLPLVAAELQRVGAALETEFHDMQDFEFTVENGQLHVLQTRAGKRTPWAALRIASDLVREGQITPAEALAHLDGLPLDRIERTHLRTDTNAAPLAVAVSASIGVAAGSIVFDARRAAELVKQGRQVILARPDILTEDIEGIAAAEGVLTTAGGRTSHAAVVARQLGKVCLVGCTEMRVEPDGMSCVIGNTRLSEGAEVTLDGDAGRVYAGRLSVVRERPEKELAELARWRVPDPSSQGDLPVAR
jgi:pyruvate, orthophosphate dikinase